MRYTNKYDEIEAIQWNGLSDSETLENFASFWVSHGIKSYITTQEGYVELSPGDYIIKTGHGHFNVLKPDVFSMLFQEECDNCHYCRCSE